jgi:alpha-D-ribose 1-methylphosphonate 5-triphosphate synthase subunit PhnG
VNDTSDSTRPAGRADWLRELAQARPDALERLAAPHVAGREFETLRAPEHGLVMVRARIGNTGDRFNVGEATVTRCVLRWRPEGGEALAGVGHVLGRDARHAERIAQLDALLQHPPLHDALWRDVIEPLRAERLARIREERTRTEASRVRFFTLQSEAA